MYETTERNPVLGCIVTDEPRMIPSFMEEGPIAASIPPVPGKLLLSPAKNLVLHTSGTFIRNHPLVDLKGRYRREWRRLSDV